MASREDGRTKILFTGGAGCISTAIIQKLLADNPKNVQCVRFDPQIPNDLVGGKYVHGSVTDKGSVIAACNQTEASVLVHVAGWNQFDFDVGQKKREDFFQLNIKGTFQMLEALPRTTCRKILYISSTSATNMVLQFCCNLERPANEAAQMDSRFTPRELPHPSYVASGATGKELDALQLQKYIKPDPGR